MYALDANNWRDQENEREKYNTLISYILMQVKFKYFSYQAKKILLNLRSNIELLTNHELIF